MTSDARSYGTDTPFRPPSRLRSISCHVPQSQRLVRLTYNDINRALDKWKDISTTGLQSLKTIINDTLSRAYYDGLDLGPLSKYPGLREAARIKYARAAARALESLADGVRQLEASVEDLARCQTTIAGAVGGCGAAAARQPVFASLPLTAIADGVAAIHAMYSEEARARALLVMELKNWLGEVSKVADGHGGVSGPRAAGPEALDPLRDRGSVLVAVWLLEAAVEPRRAEAFLTGLRDDMAVS